MVYASMPSGAEACAVCKCGDPTLTTMGNEQPFAGRRRAATEFRYRQDSVGSEGIDQVDLREVRMDLSFSYAPSTRWLFAATLPVVARRLSYVNLGKDETLGLGEAEFRARRVFGAGMATNSRQLWSLTGGLKAPTAPTYYDSSGQPISVDLQAGTGSWDFIGGASWARFFHPSSVYASVAVQIPSMGLEEMQIDPMYFATLAVQRQWGTKVSLRGAIDGRAGGQTHFATELDPNTGGWIVYGGGDLLFSSLEDVVLKVGANYPIYQALKGEHREGLMASLGIIYDF